MHILYNLLYLVVVSFDAFVSPQPLLHMYTVTARTLSIRKDQHHVSSCAWFRPKAPLANKPFFVELEEKKYTALAFIGAKYIVVDITSFEFEVI